MRPKTIVTLLNPTDAWLTRRVVLIGLFIAIAAFYAITLPANHSEAGDGYDYAYRAESVSVSNIDDTRAILFGFINKLLYQASEILGLGLRALPLLLAFEVLCGAASVLLMARLLQTGYGLSASASWSGAAFLGLSYGFWRYTGEVEVYIPSIFLVLATANLIFDRLEGECPSWRSLIPAGVLAGLSGLYYQPNVVPLFIAVPVLMLSRRGLPCLIAYGVSGSAVAAAGGIAAYLVETGASLSTGGLIAFATSRAEEFSSKPLDLGTLVAGVQAIVHNYFSLNWVFAIHEVTQWLQHHFNGAAITPKVFTAEYFRPFVYMAIPFFVLFVGLTCWMLVMAIWTVRHQPFDRRSLFSVIWFAALFAVIAFLDPASREPWIIAVPPVIILFSVYVFEPLVRQGRQATVLLFLGTLLFGNFFGGIGMIQSSAGDYYYNRMNWLRAHSSPNDVILFSYQNQFRRPAIYLQYVAKMRVRVYPPDKECPANEDFAQIQFLQSLLDSSREDRSRIYVLSDFFIDDWGVVKQSARNHCKLERAKNFIARIRKYLHLVHSGPLGETFEIKP